MRSKTISKRPLTEEEKALVEENVGLAFAHVLRAGKFHHENDKEDEYQDAALGLIRAAKSYDPKKAAFSTYADRWMWSFLVRGRRESRSLIHVPHRTIEAPEGSAVRARFGSDADRARDVRSFDALEGSSGHPTSNDDPAAEVELADLTERLHEAISELEPRERHTIEQRFFARRTLLDIGRELGVSKERARQFEGDAIAKLREIMQ